MTKDLFNLSGRVVVLTGGLGLIGLNYIEAFISQGAFVNVIDIVKKETADKILRKKFKGDKSRIRYFRADISDKPSLERVKKELLKKFGVIDVLINNAALTHKVEHLSKQKSKDYSFEKLKLSEWEEEIKINLTGTMLCCQVFGSAMKTGASIINIASIYGAVAPDQSIYQKGYQQPATYGVTKAGVIYLTKYLATYWGHKGIRANCLVLGGVENGQNQEFLKKYAQKTPMGRMAKPDEFNGLLLYLASDSSSYVTGSAYAVDGGWTAW
ncbi:MAG: hypothetical protein A2102_02920 [Tenericutes bacterium GWF2_38_8]|nr:MAG: hypothetical protein A2102_02920 [Tenericutes bacterium GWF2_38_8]